MYTRRKQLLSILAAWLVAATVGGSAPGAPPVADTGTSTLLLQSPTWADARPVIPGGGGSTNHRASVIGVAAQPTSPVPALPPPASPDPLDDRAILTQEVPSPVLEEDCQPRGVRPYGGGSPADWSWGCGGSPYRTGPGLCDDWKVGCRWHVAADGIVMSRDDANLSALTAATNTDSAGDPQGDPMLEQFSYGPGGRVAFMSQVPRYVGYQMYFSYEGIEEWNASVVYPKFSPLPGSLDPFSSEQRSVHYRSSLHSAEINFVRMWHPTLQPFCGVRYIKFDDEINDFINQEAPPPLPADPAVTTTDLLNLFDLENNLIGFQLGTGYQFLQLGERFSIEGFLNAGVYYNRIKYTNIMGNYTTQAFPDGTSAFANAVNNDVSELSEISYVAESSISAVCRLNRCWALRTGYQMLGIGNLHLAEDAFLNTGNDAQDLFFYGWHAGIECRR